MRINTLHIENFQGIRDATFDLGGHSASIYGDNGTGKTTVFNAITWLLFDRASTGAKNFTPKTRGPGGDLHHLEHMAEAQFIMDDGRLVQLRKVFHENYKKKRGAATAEFDGHSIDFYIDGVPVKEKEYTATLQALCGGAEKMKMLTMPNYFPEEMAWDARRKILLEVCGDVTDGDVIVGHPELEELDTYLLMPGTTRQFYSVEEYRKVAAAQKTAINKQLQEIPGRIDEAQRAIPEVDASPEEITAELERLEAQSQQITQRKATILAGNTATAEAQKRTAEADAKVAEARAAYITNASTVNAGTNAAIGEVQRQIVAVRSRLNEAKAEAERQEALAERMAARRKELLEEYSRIQAEYWDEGEAICPTCHQALPADQVEDMRQQFNIRKSNRLQAINEKGQKEASKDMIASAQQAAETEHQKAEAAEVELKGLEQQLSTLQGKLAQTPPFETTQEYHDLMEYAAKCRVEEAEAGMDTSAALDGVNNELEAVQSRARELQRKRSFLAQAETQRKRIAELEAKEKDLSCQYEELEKGLYLCDLFIKAKVDMLTERINSKFKSVRFRLFQEQVNGGVKDDCEVLVPTAEGVLVPYTFANNAARINAGLEIIGALSAHWGLTMPVFIDNAESITHIAALPSQVVRLVVSEADSRLRLEVDAAETEGAA